METTKYNGKTPAQQECGPKVSCLLYITKYILIHQTLPEYINGHTYNSRNYLAMYQKSIASHKK